MEICIQVNTVFIERVLLPLLSPFPPLSEEEAEESIYQSQAIGASQESFIGCGASAARI